jgi:hypothetical protein
VTRIRLSTTFLETWRRYLDPDQAYLTEADLVASLERRVTPTPAMRLGSAFDAVLNDPDAHRIAGGDGYQAGDYLFPAEVMEPALALFDRRGLFQVKATKTYGDVEVVAVADQLVGVQLVENKTTTSNFDADKYAWSAQWRLMTDIFAPRFITYHVFQLREPKDGAIELVGIHTMHLFPYAGLHRDCQSLIESCAAWIVARGLDGPLRQRQAEADAA